MTTLLQREIDVLKQKILALGTIVEDNLWNAAKAVTDRDAMLARKIVDSDPVIDRMEVEVEEECLKILALHQPVAIDLRFIVAVLKINNDLERIGDLGVHIAEQAAYFAEHQTVNLPFDVETLANKVKAILRTSLDALVNLDPQAARQVMLDDDEVDAMNRHMYDQIGQAIPSHIDQLDTLLRYRSVSRYLERVADHATNIAEDVIYMTEGRIVRHTEEHAGNMKPN